MTNQYVLRRSDGQYLRSATAVSWTPDWKDAATLELEIAQAAAKAHDLKLVARRFLERLHP